MNRHVKGITPKSDKSKYHERRHVTMSIGGLVFLYVSIYGLVVLEILHSKAELCVREADVYFTIFILLAHNLEKLIYKPATS